MSYNPESYWAKRENPNKYNTLQDWDINILKPLCDKADSILDFGSGNGRTFELYKGKDVVAYDIVDKHVDVLRAKAKEHDLNMFKFIQGDIDYHFDLGVINKVLLHEPNPEWIVNYVATKCDTVFISTGVNMVAEHCFNHDYEDLLRQYDIKSWDQNGNDLTIVF